MKSNYKRLGDYIREVNNRNTELRVTNLLGINIDKFFMPSVANVVGTDMTSYKIVRMGQFACNRMHVGRDQRLPVALSRDSSDFLVSPAYNVFEVIDPNALLPEYLMMWFSRREFDRNAWFYTDADVRGGLNWKDFCNMELPVPDIAKQREIVKEYNVLVNRIVLNNQLNQKLEETAQAIYKQWFLDFEFPDKDGKPYKSNGGEMVESELGEIPKGWQVEPISLLSNITSSKRIYESEYTKNGIPFFRGKEISLKKAGEPIDELIYISERRYNELLKVFGKPKKGDILMTAVGTIGVTYLVQKEEFYFKDGNIIWFKDFKSEGLNYFLYDFMQSKMFNLIINEITIGSTQSAITIATFGQQKIVIPNIHILKTYVKKSIVLNSKISNLKSININLYKLISLLLAKISKAECQQ
jgi:type I restriction enzyme, S subunit